MSSYVFIAVFAIFGLFSGIMGQALTVGDPSRIALTGKWQAEVVGGRTATLVLPDPRASEIAIDAQPRFGHVSVNPDGSLALVLTGTDALHGTLSFPISYNSGGSRRAQTVRVNVAPSKQAAGWAPGIHYMLETDSNDDVIVEPGQNHRKVYVTNGPRALTRQRIATIENINPDRVKRGWLLKHPKYGATPDFALSPDLGLEVWNALFGQRVRPGSHWLLFERGYTYSNLPRLGPRGMRGESPLHPAVISSYGTGPQPVVDSELKLFQEYFENIVVTDIHLTGGVVALWGGNLLFDDVTISDEHFVVTSVNGITLRNSDVVDVIKDAPDPPGAIWHAHKNRISGLYGSKSTGVLIEGTLFDHNGWASDYDFNMSTKAGQPPSYYSHNVYLQWNNLDVTFRNNIVMRGASYGAQVRSGGVIEDNLFLDNNAAVIFLGGNYEKRGYLGHYTLYADNVVTSGAHKRVAEKEGGLTLGVGEYGMLTTMTGSVIAHLADPANPKEQRAKTVAHAPLTFAKGTGGPFFNDTIIYNWSTPQTAHPDLNADHLPQDTMDAVTIQTISKRLAGKRATGIPALASHLRGLADTAQDDQLPARDFVEAFQAGFGIKVPRRRAADRLRFVPHGLADGIRWDNRMNWTTQTLPGLFPGDSVDLGGNHVHFSGTARLDGLTFGRDGALAVTQGFLSLRKGLDAGRHAAHLYLSGAGQVWTNGMQGRLQVDARGGRFGNTGQIEGGLSMRASGQAQVILATPEASARFGQNDVLHIVGGTAQVGFDGTRGKSPARLHLGNGSVLRYSVADGRLGSLRAFHSGRFGTSRSDINTQLSLDGALLRIDLAGFQTADRTQELLISVDDLSGAFSGLEISGLTKDRDARVLVDYDADGVFLELSARGDGRGRASLVSFADGRARTDGNARLVRPEQMTETSAISFLP